MNEATFLPKARGINCRFSFSLSEVRTPPSSLQQHCDKPRVFSYHNTSPL